MKRTVTVYFQAYREYEVEGETSCDLINNAQCQFDNEAVDVTMASAEYVDNSSEIELN